MVERSLKIKEQYLKKAENALTNLRLKQEELARRLGLSRGTVSKFLNGKTIYKENFVNICETLKLDWQEITGLNNKSFHQTEDNINGLVTQLRQQVKADIETRCGTMRIFDMSQPIELGKIYTQVNILEKISSRRRRDITELLEIYNVKEIERFNFGAVTEERIPGKEAVSRHKKLLILGKPGAGKTTFLKHLAIQSIRDKFQGYLVPFFVTLKEFAEDDDKPNLLTYLDPPKSPLTRGTNQNAVEQILDNGKALILLDGLDEVLEAHTKRVIREIENLTNKYPENQYLMTCRIAAKEYTFVRFTEVEIADFNDKQIATFAENWFKDKPIKPETFLERLQTEQPIKELVSSPLLLTLLCISFEELGDFPANRKELYEEGIDALLKKWDAKRGVQRDKVYKPLSIAKKEDLLSKIAWETFSVGDYFFKQDKAERLISEYIRNLPGANLDDEALQGDSEIVLKNIEAQHGLLVARAKQIYSFSHLTFQEYFTAREIIFVRQSSDEALRELVSHLFEKRWLEVFLLAVAMSPNAERLVLLMKEKIDRLLADDADLQRYLQWLNEKALEDKIKFHLSKYHLMDKKITQERFKFYVNYDLPLTKVFYFGLYLNINNNELYLDIYRNFSIAHLPLNQNIDLNLYYNLYINLHIYINRGTYTLYPGNVYNSYDRNLYLAQRYEPKLYVALLKLKEGLPYEDVKDINSNEAFKAFEAWWKANGKAWTDDFRQAMIQHRNIGHDWQFSEAQKTILEQYYRANQLLTQCLHQDCYIRLEVRQYIEETLLLPIDKIQPFAYNT